MPSNKVWTSVRVKARANEYEGRCVTCGNTVMPLSGQLVSTEAGGLPLANGVVHERCDLPSNYHYRARMGLGCVLEDTKPPSQLKAVQPTEVQGNSVEPEPPREPTEQELQRAAQVIVEDVTAKFLSEVPNLVRNTLSELTRTVEIKVGTAPKIKVEHAHKSLADVIATVCAGVDPFLVGPAGSGKTTLARQCCDAMRRKFYAENRVTSEYKLLGYMDATGKYVRTQFREAFEKGGGFLLDEVDASDPDVLTTFNSALANRVCPFPDKLITAHKDFFAIAAGNTYGRGADREYVGRNQLDAATLDRFVIIEIDYDEAAELAWAMNDDWTLYVQQIRKAIEQEKVRHIVSPRASIFGARLLAAGMERSLVEERCVWKGLDTLQRQRVTQRMGTGL